MTSVKARPGTTGEDAPTQPEIPATITRRTANLGLMSSVALAAAGGQAQAPAAIDLPPARQRGGKPLMEALMLRRSTRAFAARALPPPVLGDLLWAAYGVNRPSGDRTAPCWRHIIVIDVYACMQDGVWRYDPAAHRRLFRESSFRPSAGVCL
ncbi:MAG: hypothetical protein L6R19_14540 [Alphaproteobacteria bacterium]|nr:hypothetical protein [Alphaproteobacteria bacterium]